MFSYIAYARLDVVHGLDPYTHSPVDVPGDAVYPFAGSKDFTSVYGPLFTVATFPLAKLERAVRVLDAEGRRRAGEPRRSSRWSGGARGGSAATRGCRRWSSGLNPLVLVHVVGGAHNDALTVLLWMGGVAALLAARPPEALAGGADRRVRSGEGVGRGARARSC